MFACLINDPSPRQTGSDKNATYNIYYTLTPASDEHTSPLSHPALSSSQTANQKVLGERGEIWKDTFFLSLYALFNSKINLGIPKILIILAILKHVDNIEISAFTFGLPRSMNWPAPKLYFICPKGSSTFSLRYL